MTKYLTLFCFALISVILIVEDVDSCMFPRDWTELPLKDRLTAANTVILGYVTNLVPSTETREDYRNNTVIYIPQYYTAKVLVTCPFHGVFNKVRQAAIELAPVNTGSSCKFTTIRKHNYYIFMLNDSLSSVKQAPMEVNYQSAAIDLTELSMDVVRTEFGKDIVKLGDEYSCPPASETKAKRKDPAKLIESDFGKLPKPNTANKITHLGLITLIVSFLVSILF
ncbi:uncharacterized protein [Antedon mediterranea]|uniref:uncharacterized protein n=1 Tax=Antedon mediterranea TaxID=105859 RepID=UPI003AF577A8